MILCLRNYGENRKNWSRQSEIYRLKNQKKFDRKMIIGRCSAKCAKTIKKFVRIYH